MSGPGPMSREAFLAYLEQQLHTLKGLTIQQREGFGWRLRIGQTEMQLGLEAMYQRYLQEPDQAEQTAELLIKALHSYKQERTITSYAELRERIYPMLKPLILLAEVRERKLPMLAYRPFLADLMITYVIDEPGSLVYINEKHLERWQIDEARLHSQAIDNLDRRTREQSNYTASGMGMQRMIVFNSQDGFDATRLLLPALLDQWRPQFPGHMVIGIPNRDFLICFSDADRTILVNIAHQIQFDAAERANGLTDQLFTLINGEVREYRWET